ncbi:MAG: IS21 family transposase [Actinobacteria bacterium]|nr:IS21 family transposase [Actinomycetota bacterium]
MTKVELFEAIRKEHFDDGKGIRRIARKRKIHRRTVRAAIDSAIPPPRKPTDREPPVLTRALRLVVDGWLTEDRKAPRKQRHTAKRVFDRLRREQEYTGAASTVRKYVSRRKREIGLSGKAHVPLTHEPGQEGEVDWYEAEVDFPWGRQTMQFFQMRACFSGREFHRAFPRQTQRAFLEGIAAALLYFCGVFAILRFDNLRSAVAKVLRGRRRKETDRFVALHSHYRFDPEFCRPGIEGAPEKGGVEGGVGRFRRNHLVPVPFAESLDDLNRQLLEHCAEDDERRIDERRHTVIEDWATEREHLRPLPQEPFPTAEVGSSEVDQKGRVCLRTNRYSVPIGLAGLKVEHRLGATKLELVHEGKVVALHERLQGRHGQRLELDHYLELLWYKPGALSRSMPLRQARDRGKWPEVYDELWRKLRARYGESEGTRHLLEVLLMHREAEAEAVHTAVELSLEYGCHDSGAIALVLRQLLVTEPEAAPLVDLGLLSRYERPADRDFGQYDQLLGLSAASSEVH